MKIYKWKKITLVQNAHRLNPANSFEGAPFQASILAGDAVGAICKAKKNFSVHIKHMNFLRPRKVALNAHQTSLKGKKMKVGIIGAGSVGSATAFALIMRGVARKVVLIDANEKKAQAEAMDIAHAAPFAYANKVKAGTYEDLKGAEVVIVTAGANQKPGETRIDLLGRNAKIFESIIPQVAKYAPDTILLITSNPADIMTEVAIKLSGFPRERVIGSGTVLDTSRFRTLLGYHLGVSPKSIHANVLGEHGDSEVLAWSNGDAGSVQIEELARMENKPFTADVKAHIDDCVRNAAYKIIDGKGATFYGIAGALCQICQAISNNEYAILTVSTHHDDVEGVKDVCLSLPTVVGKRGVHGIIYPKLSESEHNDLRYSAQKIKEYSDKAVEIVSKDLEEGLKSA